MKKYSDLPSDGGSNILAQVIQQKRSIAANLAPIRHMLAVGSGKGGVGKSTLTMLLALALQRRGRRPAVLDADINGPSQARLGGLSLRTPVPGKQGLLVPRSPDGIGVVSFGTLVPEEQAVDFPTLAAGDSFTWRATKEFSVLGEILGGTDWTPFDLLLLDLPPGAERTFQYAEFLGQQAQFVLVTLPTDLSRGVVRRSLEALRRTPNRILGCVENMKGYYCSECRQTRPLFPDSPTAVDLPLRLLGSVPFDPELTRLCDAGLSLEGLAESAALKAVEAVCDNLLAAMEEG